MDKINRNNYEAFFLDFAEGNLSEAQRREVLDFIQANPDLKEELEEFELIELPREDEQSGNWSELKKERDYTSSQELRDELYFKALEDDLTAEENTAFSELLKKRQFAEEYELWKRLKLTPSDERNEWSDLYELGLGKEMTKTNFDHFLIAASEGLLSEAQEKELAILAAKIPGGEQEMQRAKKLRIKAPVAIFYPDKEKLYRKKERAGLLIWFARTAAVAALFIIGYFIISEYQNEKEIQVAEEIKTDSTETKRIKPGEDEEVRSGDALDEKTEKKKGLPARQFENPIAFDTQKKSVKIQDKKSSRMNSLKPIAPEAIAIEHSVAFGQAIAMREEGIIQVEKGADQINPVEPDYDDYQTLPELAEDYLASRFDYTENGSRGIVPTMAEKIAERAGKALDTEIKTEENQAKDQSTFTFRVGNFKVTRTNSK